METILKKINQATIRFLEPLTAEETYKIIVDESIKLVKAKFGSIFLQNKGSLNRAFTNNPQLWKITPRNRGFTYQAFKQMSSKVIKSIQFTKIHPQIKSMGIKSVIFIPLSYHKKSIGVISLDSKTSPDFTIKELELLKLFGSLATLAIKKTQLYDETKEALNSRDLFISMAAHEFRTPMTTIYGYTQLLDKSLTRLNLKEALWIKKLFFELTRITKIINELLEINQIKSGNILAFKKKCHLLEIVKRALDDFKFAHTNRQFIIENQLNNHSDLIYADFFKILQVINNLTDNAAKFSDPNTKIILNLQYSKPYLILKISDQGEGIHKKNLPHIFKEFYKESDKKSGMGLGLYLTKNIIEQHNGTIKIYTQRNNGTTAEVKLPIVK